MAIKLMTLMVVQKWFQINNTLFVHQGALWAVNCLIWRVLALSLQDEEENVYKRDFSAPTLEDHFNKTILPKVMQVSWSLHSAGLLKPRCVLIHLGLFYYRLFTSDDSS